VQRVLAIIVHRATPVKAAPVASSADAKPAGTLELLIEGTPPAKVVVSGEKDLEAPSLAATKSSITPVANGTYQNGANDSANQSSVLPTIGKPDPAYVERQRRRMERLERLGALAAGSRRG